MKIKELRLCENGDYDIVLSFSKKDTKIQYLSPEHIQKLYVDIVRSFLQDRPTFIKTVGFDDVNFSKIKIKCDEHNIWHTADRECSVCIAAGREIKEAKQP